ncbi:MAG: ABC transporter substrate-binding protein [Deltaproteobacteria bacterium]|nr:ABC transporter substrate-binding protein [Deltaproteobacteria bacterium]
MFKLINKIFILLTIFTLALAVPGAMAAAPAEVTKQVIDKALDILNDPNLAGPALKNRRFSKVKQLVDQHFDYREMAKRSLGPTWNKISSSQKDEFVRLFAELLEASYADKIDRYAKRVRIDYTGQTQDGNYAEVRTVVVRPNDRIPISYRLLNEAGTWKVYDVSIEGVSLVGNYRTQFGRIISESSYEDLVKRLRTKVSENRSGA